MENSNRKHHIFLTGFMASGKTCVGKALAQQLSIKFIDTDEIIEAASGMPISDIFMQHGEKIFRLLEKDTIRKIVSFDPCVIALGGGAFIPPENRKLILKAGTSVAISWPAEIILKRVGDEKTRPLLRGLNRKERLRKISSLLKEREKFYRQADIYLHFPCPASIERVVETILENLEKPEWKKSK